MSGGSPYTLACAECGKNTRVQCANCRKLFCFDHLTKILGAGNAITPLCSACVAIYASNPACYGPLRFAGEWSDEDQKLLAG
jgi:hypothetical protein